MAEESEEKVKVELKLPKSEVSIKDDGGSSAAEERYRKEVEAAEKKKDKERGKKEVAGYRPSAIAKAPLEPPEPKDKKGPNVHQKRVVVFGFFLAAASLILWPLISFWFFVAVACAAALVVAYGTFIRI